MFWRRRKQTDFNAEVESHLEMEVERLREQGLSEKDARAAARRAFGNVTRAEERFYESSRWMWWDNLRQDIRYGLRQLRRNPGFTAVAAITLALGIGGTTAIFSAVNAFLLRPLPYKDSDRLVSLWATFPHWGFSGPGALTDPDFVEWQKQNQVFDGISAFRGQTSNLTGAGDPERLLGATVTASFFPLFSVQPESGRAFSAAEENETGGKVVVLSHGLWARRFGSDPAMVGKSLTLDGKSFTVIGVMPENFQFPNRADFWTPLVLTTSRDNAMDQIVARLKPGVTLERAQNDIQLIQHRLNPHAGPDAIRQSLVYLHDEMVSNYRPALLILLAAVGLVLLIACANVANLFLARAAVREREITIRKALGGTRRRMIRQMLTESLVLACLGGALGLLLAYISSGFLVRLLPVNAARPGGISQAVSVNIDGWVLGFAALITVATGILFGMAPALQAAKVDINSSLKETPGTHTPGLRLTGARGLLTMGQVALTLVLLVSAGLLIKSLLKLLRVSPGFSPNNLLCMNLELPSPKYSTPVQMRAFHAAMLERIESLPGVTGAGTVGFGIPFGEGGIGGDFTVEGQPAPPQGVSASKLVVSPGYIRTMRIPLLSGRYFSRDDADDSQRVAIVSEGFARRFWPDGKALGRRIDPGFSRSSWCTVVGIVGDVKETGLASQAPLTIYLPYSQAPGEFLMSFMTLVVRTPSDSKGIASAVRHEVQAVDRDLPVFGVTSMEDLIATSTSEPRSRSILLGCFAALALLLAAVGIFGVISYSVSQRKQEIGVRMALGAQKQDVMRMVVGQGLRLAMIGMGAGVIGSLALTKYLATLLYGVEPSDPMTFAAVSLLLIAVVLLACYIPARRATKVDPTVALRYE